MLRNVFRSDNRSLEVFAHLSQRVVAGLIKSYFSYTLVVGDLRIAAQKPCFGVDSFILGRDEY
jgi:hypothetical protein